MNSRERVLSAFERSGYDRIPVKHEGTPEVNRMIMDHFGLKNMEQLLRVVGDDFRYVEPVYCGPELKTFPDGRADRRATCWASAETPPRAARRPKAFDPSRKQGGLRCYRFTCQLPSAAIVIAVLPMVAVAVPVPSTLVLIFLAILAGSSPSLNGRRTLSHISSRSRVGARLLSGSTLSRRHFPPFVQIPVAVHVAVSKADVRIVGSMEVPGMPFP